MTDRLQKKINDKQIHFIEDGIPSRWDEKSMTHDELLTLLYAKSDSDEVHALCAVVELHHEHTSGSGDIYCYNCQQKYPCLTIKAIEKELG